MAVKKIVDVTTEGWSAEDVQTLREKVQAQKFKYRVDIKMKDGKIRFAYMNNDPALAKAYIESVGGKILKVTEL